MAHGGGASGCIICISKTEGGILVGRRIEKFTGVTSGYERNTALGCNTIKIRHGVFAT